MKKLGRIGLWAVIALTVATAASTVSALKPGLVPQEFDRVTRGRVKLMLEQVRDEVRNNYYDSTFHGIDFDAHFKRASDRLDQATSLRQGLGIIAQALLDFNDSHLYFDPPSRTVSVRYGYEVRMVGDRCYVDAVHPKLDAHAKGLRAGDLVLSVQGFKPTRAELWKMNYFYYVLSPQPAHKLMVQSPGGQPREVQIASEMTQQRRSINLSDTLDFDEFYRSLDSAGPDHRFQTVSDVTIWKMPAFDLSADEVNDVMSKNVKGAALVLDLRGNGGGYVDTLEALVAHFFDHDIKIADMKGRKESKPAMAKKRSGAPFKGRLVVLVDSQSASASELFARVMQIEHRGTVIGDRSAGAVMQSHYFSGKIGAESLVLFGASVTDADAIMSDGGRLEGAGVVPDELLLPQPEDLAAGRDPVLARAITSLGGSMDAEKAGKLFPRIWK